MTKLKHIVWDGKAANIQADVPVSVSGFITQVGKGISTAEMSVSSLDLESFIDFASQQINDSVIENARGLSHQEYVVREGGAAGVLYDAINCADAWPEALGRIVQSRERRVSMVMYAFALLQMDRFIDLRMMGNIDGAIDAFGEAANAARDASCDYGFSRPVADGFAVGVGEHYEELKETAHKVRKEDQSRRGSMRSKEDEDSRRNVFAWLEKNYHKYTKRAPAVREIIALRLVGSSYDTIDGYIKEYADHKKVKK